MVSFYSRTMEKIAGASYIILKTSFELDRKSPVELPHPGCDIRYTAYVLLNWNYNYQVTVCDTSQHIFTPEGLMALYTCDMACEGTSHPVLTDRLSTGSGNNFHFISYTEK